MLSSNLATAKKANRGKLSLAACLLLAKSVMAETSFETQGLGDRDSTWLKGLTKLSLMGGTQVTIKTDGGLDMNAQLNAISVKCKQIPQSSFQLSAISDDDAFSSDTAAGKLAWTIPPAAEIFSSPSKQYTYFDFNNLPGGLPGAYLHPTGGIDYLTFDVDVASADHRINCGAAPFSLCSFQYDQRYTPEIYDTSPNQVTAGELINITIDPKRAFYYKIPRDVEPFSEIKLGDRNTDWEGLIASTWRPYDYKVTSIPTRVGDNKPTKSVKPDVNYTQVGRSFIRETARHCNFSGKDCWTVRIHPKIDKISASTGYLSGGQTLEITGFGLSGQDISVRVDNVGCLVNFSLSSDKSIFCETGSKVTPSLVGVSQPGNYGVSHSYVNPSDKSQNVDWSQIKTNVFPTVKSLKTTLETIRFVYEEKSAHSFDGWFFAPETGQYKFYLSGDDQIRLYMDVTNPYDSTVPYTQNLLIDANLKAFSYYYPTWRQYEKLPSPSNDPLGKYQSDWLNLEAGKYYKFAFQHIDTMGDYWSIGSFEFTKLGFNANGHPKASKAIQNLRIEADPNRAEQWTITCNNVSSTSNDSFILSLTSPNSSTVFRSNSIKCKNDAWGVQYRIASFFESCSSGSYGICSKIETKRTMYTSAGVETTDSSQARKYVYTTYLKKRINGSSFISYQVTPVGTIASTVTVTPPYNGGVLSSGAISGSFKIRCPDPQGIVWTTRANVFNTENSYIQSSIDEDIPWLRGRVSVHTWTDGTINDEFKFNYRQNGVNIFLTFDGLHSDPPQCTILSDNEDPMTIGNAGVTLKYVGETVRNYGTGLMFEPVGLEFIYTDAQQPQVMVKVDGLEAICTDLNCDYAYVQSTAEITAQTYDTNTQVVTVQGTNLPITDPNNDPDDTRRKRKISLGGAYCGENPAPILSDTLIQCTLSSKPRAGAHKVQIKTAQGLIAHSSDVSDIQIPLFVSAVSPSKVNPLGGGIITITGTGFPDQSQLVKVGFSDNTDCEVKSTSNNQIVCQVVGFATNDGIAREIVISVLEILNNDGAPIMNSKKYQTHREIGFIENIPKVVSIDKTNVSPILKQSLTFTLDASYTDALNASDLRVELRQAASNYSRELYVMSVNDSTKQFTVKFNGAPIGQYTFYVEANSSSQYGQLDTKEIIINTESTITSISPLTGSVLGGTVLTIQGTNFSQTVSDQAVTVGKYYCDILTASATELTCRVRETNRSVDQVSVNNEVVVTLAASSESTCLGQCMFSFSLPSAGINSVNQSFNKATSNILIYVTGVGFLARNSSNISLLIDGKKQNLRSVVSDTSMIFTLSDINKEATSSITILFEDGYPANYKSLVPITFTPSYASVYPNSNGSFGGTLLQVSAPGLGVESTSVNLFSTALNKNICSEVKITQYGSFNCLTIRSAIQPTDTLKLVVGTVKYDCANSDLNLCKYSQLSTNSPGVTKVVLSGNVMTFTGTLFPSTTGFTLHASYQSMIVQLTTWTATSAIATFPQGLPASATLILPKLFFTRLSDGVVFYAFNSNKSVANPLTLTSANSTNDLSVSYAGGLQFTVTKANVYATLLEKSNRLEICGNVCKPVEQLSDINKVTCTLPALATYYSVMNYQIIEPGVLTGTWTANYQSEVQNVYDGIYTTQYNSSKPCFIQLAFPDGQVGLINSAQVLINDLDSNKAPFVGNTVLQGFDGVNYVDLWRLDNTITEGWNTKNWSDGSEPVYSAYRWSSVAYGCTFAEVVFTGMVGKNDAASSTQCTAKLFVGTTSTTLSQVTYTATKTPQIDSIVPRYGKVSGNELITINGDNFVDGSTTVTIDKIPCAIQSVTTTQIKCFTGKRIGDEPDPSFVVFVQGSGLAVNQGNTFSYVQYWSEPSTWGNDAPPQFGEAVQIPLGRTLLVDVDKVPQLSFVLVEGALIFAPHPDPNHQRTFDAGYIFIKGGYMEVGTEEHPYTSKLTITMHGDPSTPAIPTTGNKNISVMHGMLSMIGQPRSVVWTLLDSTVLPNANQITLEPQASTFDWAVGEQIIIAPTSFNKDEAEVRTIVAVGQDADVATKPVLTLDRPLLYKHYAATETYGEDFIDMRAEVGLLSRNVKFRGDPETSAKNQYGAHIMLHGHGEETAIGKIMYIELTDVGQAFKMGRYPIHFHMLGKAARSIVKGNSVHQTYNRGVVLHAVSYFRVIQNVFYNTMGHSVFLEDAIETKNIIDGNLVIKTNRSWSILNSDQTPASFWITNPDNTIINNRAAGSDRYGFWFDLQVHPTGLSSTNTICPNQTKLGEFRNNVAHSNGRYGLRIFDGHVPRTNPCAALVYDNSNPSAVGAPYPSNPVIPAVYQDFTSWKNNKSGAIVEKTGAVIWKNFKVADNLISGLEWSFVAPEIKSDGFSMIDGALVIGKSQNTEEGLEIASPKGVIGPRTEWFTAQNIKFYNFSFKNGGYPLGDCSHCSSAASTDSGARTITVRGLTFDSTVKKRIKYEVPFRGIFLDADGSLTGLGAGSWASANFKHNEQPECMTNLSVYDGQICDNNVQVRRVAFHGVNPSWIEGLNLRIAKFDDSQMALLTAEQLDAYQLDLNNYSKAPMTMNQDPVESWAVPFVTGHKYRWFFDQGQHDILNLKIELSPRWQQEDKYLLLNLPYTDNREHIDIYRSYDQSYATSNSSGLIPNGSLSQSIYADWQSGFNYNDNITKKEFNMVITGNQSGSKTLQLNGVTCRDNLVSWCAPPAPPTTCTGETKLWSNTATWPLGRLPVDGEDVTIPSGVIIVFDLEESPILKLIKVDGCLRFLSTGEKDQHLKAYQVFVSSGKFSIGSEAAPYSRKAKITLYGDIASQTVTMTNAIEAGNKLISNNGEVEMYGKSRSRMSRLLAEAQKGASTVTVQTGLDWVAGDMLGFAATGLKHTEAESATILSYNSSTGIVVLTQALEYYHFGSAVSTATNYQGLDMRGEVILLTRNIVIQGDSTQNDWQGQFVTSDALKVDWQKNSINYQGLTTLKNVEFNNMGQMNTTKAALRFENSRRDGNILYSKVSNCVFHHNGGFAISVVLSKNVKVQNCDVFHAKQIGVNIDVVTNVNFDSVNVFDVRNRNAINTMNLEDKETCVAFCTYSEGTNCFTSSFTNSIIGGCPFAGILGQGYSCNDLVGESSTINIKNIVVHSVDGSGASFMPNRALSETSTCYQFSHIQAYKNRGAGIGTMYKTLEMRASNIVLVDNQLGITLNIAGTGTDEKVIQFSDSFIYGESDDLSNDCPDPATGAACYCPDKYGFMNFHGQLRSKDAHITSSSSRPLHKVKSDALWDTKVQLNQVSFINFKSTSTACNSRQSAFGLSPGYAPDQIPIHKFYGTKFTNVHPDAIAYLKDPLAAWVTIDNCGQFPCTGWSNVVLNFYNAVFEVNDGVTPLPTYWTAGLTSYDFQIVGKVLEAGETYSNCALNEAMNAYFCANTVQDLPPTIGVLVFESLDLDSRTRMVAPVVIKNDKGYENVINAFMDHAWEGFYTSMNRLSRFVAHVETGLNYTVTYAGTPPKNIRYTLRSDQDTEGVIIKVPYPDAGSYDVLVDSNLIDPQPWDAETKQPGLINPETAVCGSNRYVGVENYLEFYVAPGCTVLVRPRDAIMASVRLSWTLEEFFANDGVTTFVQRLAAALGIDPSRVKVVSIYTGSVNVQVFVLSDPESVEINPDGSVIPSEKTYMELAVLQEIINSVLTPRTSSYGVMQSSIFGAPVLELESNIQAEILGCQLKLEDCPQPWTVVNQSGFDNFECALGNSEVGQTSNIERCNYTALPDLDYDSCQCVCKQDPYACPKNAPYFDPSICKCVCPFKDHCRRNQTFREESCSCECGIEAKDCPKNKPFLNKRSCMCECNQREEKCPRAFPDFDEDTCSCIKRSK